ncbi:septum formation protein [Porphyromonadaceae bacterium NLAE-zl-C104]|jgi:septum formation protein|uniref:Maf-like protein n=1 Tax=Proteiniphilum TaxID=294702 RepID=UPI000896384F|nr:MULTISPECIES: Maf-like protein [Proteiniphilum]MDY9918060.1 Maf-like protein [Proteiniphilum sp.]SDZ94358.1 septum formation protein [Porphyromonadaceae bacterium KH3R12]SFS87774.1 septum formation protein [Porphyromonadaceae bacterium NLAE-zl-C104]
MGIFTNKNHLVLASNSPRRKELLSGIDVEYEVMALPDIDESYPDDIPHEEIPEYLAKKKASAYISMMQDDALLITADTVVLLHGRILGKPLDKRDAKQMLRELSGETHRVITGVSLTSKQKQVSFSDTAHVTFGQLTDEEIDYYVEKYNPSDKAGAYGVQEWIGYVGVERIEGSYFNVMGLPIFKVYRELKRF